MADRRVFDVVSAGAGAAGIAACQPAVSAVKRIIEVLPQAS
jgi:hypothetical protein